MLFNVAQLLQEQIGSERRFTIDGIYPDIVEGDNTPVSGDVRLVRTNRGVLAYATVEALVRDTCSRCLGALEMPVQVSIVEEFLPTVDVHTGQPLPRLEDDSDAFLIDDHHHLDLTEAIRQFLVTQQPMRPLCREDCAGLCPTCGADLNQRACDCPEEPVDDRWAALRALHVTES